MKTKKSLLLLILMIILPNLFSISCINNNQETDITEQIYNDIIKHYDQEKPGYGLLDYPGNISGDNPKSYAMFLSAEIGHASINSNFQLSNLGTNAGHWLIENSDLNNDGIVGWGLPVEWDAFGDGTVNKKNTSYTISTAIVINSLLDWMQNDPNAPFNQIYQEIDSAIKPYTNNLFNSKSGLFMYSLSKNDAEYDTFNPSAFLVGQMQRFSSYVEDMIHRKKITDSADKIVSILLNNKQIDKNGGWYWFYSIQEESPNSLVHALYIYEGLKNYIAYGGTLSNQIDLDAVINHFKNFISDNGSLFQFAQLGDNFDATLPRLYDLGMFLNFISTDRIENILKIERNQVLAFSKNYRDDKGYYHTYPRDYIKDDENPIINEYESYLLYGLFPIKYKEENRISSNPNNYDFFDVNKFEKIPLIFFDTENHKIEFLFNVSAMEGKFNIDKKNEINLPPSNLPIKVLEWKKNVLFVFIREFFTDEIKLFIINLGNNTLQILRLDDSLKHDLFRQATIISNEMVFILYNHIENFNYMYRYFIDDSKDNFIEFDKSFREEIRISENYNYQQQPHILTTSFNDSVYFASQSNIFQYSPQKGVFVYPKLRELDDYQIIEICSNAFSVLGLYSNTNKITKKGGEKPQFIIFNLFSQKILKNDFNKSIPFSLEATEKFYKYKVVRNSKDLTEMLLQDFKNLASSGLMSAGISNSEGELIWSQSYYLNGFIDLLNNQGDPGSIFALNEIKPDIKKRLDFEFALLDRLIGERNGIECKKFTVDRSPVLHAVQTGKLLLLFKRYLFDSLQPLTILNYQRFRELVVNLKNHIEKIGVATEKNEPSLNPSRNFLFWPKGSPFWADGVGIPYNHQNCWSSGVLYKEDLQNLPSNIVNAVNDISQQVLDYEGFRSNPPKYDKQYLSTPNYFQWHYWWGRAKSGWTKNENISINTPEWGGDGENMAIEVYKTFDAISILVAGSYFDGIINDGLLNYFKSGLENDELDMFLIPYLSVYDIRPQIPINQILLHIRFGYQTDLKNVFWYYRFLYKYLLKTQ